MIVAASIVAAVGEFSRFDSPDRLVSSVGLNPRVRQSGNSPAVHGRITKSGRGQARRILVEAAFAASRAPGPLRAFHRRVAAWRGWQVATVATARKLTVLCWHLIHRLIPGTVISQKVGSEAVVTATGRLGSDACSTVALPGIYRLTGRETGGRGPTR